MIFQYGTENDIDRFRAMHSEIIEYYQCIEYDLKRIYSAMSSEDFDDCMDMLEGNNWGMVLTRLKKLDNSDGDPYLSEEEYRLLDEIRDRRNYWCHQCYLDFVYIDDQREQDNRLSRLVRQLENEKNRAAKVQAKIQDIYFDYFVEE